MRGLYKYSILCDSSKSNIYIIITPDILKAILANRRAIIAL